MTLSELIEALNAEDPTRTVPRGFAEPHSYRGFYQDVAFEPADDVTICSMLTCARDALGTTYEGYKGGEYTMRDDTYCWISWHGTTGQELDLPTLQDMLRVMLPAGVADEAPPAAPESPADTLRRAADLTPAQELRSASARLRRRAPKAQRGPWCVHEAQGGFLRVMHRNAPSSSLCDSSGIDLSMDNLGTAEYIAAMHPGVGSALGQLLLTVADFAEQLDEREPNAIVAQALTAARQILKEA